MATKTYYLKFGSGDPRTNTGLAPTFVIFNLAGLTAITGPTIMELPAASGLYQFAYGPTLATIFLADGGAALSAGDRYIAGTLDPIQAVDQQLGYSTDSYGSTSADPGSIWGFIKRLTEWNEGDKLFTKSTGIWQIFNRGSTTLLRQKTLTDTTTSSTSS